ncbi:MAG TPA: T9SS type A sorting domain-containing protein [Bacteroidota bacterium]|nr:T9SS type A sorting domain-containing protein [Bacteroidota bacterium]
MRGSVLFPLLLTLVLNCSWAQYVQQGGKLIGFGSSGIASQGESVALSADGLTAIVGGPFDSSGAGSAWVFILSGGAWKQQGPKLTGALTNSNVTGSDFGASVAISTDGNTVVVGAPGDGGHKGAAWIFVRVSGTWIQQGSKLVGSGAIDGSSGAQQGESVSISADGNTVMLGGPLDDFGEGAAWIFSRSAQTWTQQGAKIVGSGSGGLALQGWAVALSGDGNTAMVGGFADFSNAGSSWIFVRTDSGWSQQGTKLFGLDATSGANIGWSVSLSADGNTAAMGGNGDNGGVGSVWVFTRIGTSWLPQGGKLSGSGAIGPANQGQTVSLSADGNTLLIGGSDDSSSTGATWVFTRSLGAWSQQGGKLVGAGAMNGPYGTGQGTSVSLSGDGNTAFIGGASDNSGAGATWVFTRSGVLWSQYGNKLVGSGAIGNAYQGQSVALSADGNSAIIGGPNDSIGVGAAWIFSRSGQNWTQQGTKLVGGGSEGLSSQGQAVSLSADGNTAMLGGPGDNGGYGASWLFVRSSGSWLQQGGKLVGVGAVNGPGGAHQGESVSTSADGNTALVGGPSDSAGFGAAWIFTRNGTSWSQQGAKLVGTGSVGSAHQGQSVALSPDGNTAALGGPLDSAGTGAVWVFVKLNGAWTQQGAKLVGLGSIGHAEQGQSVSLSSDGNTLLVGGSNDSSGAGAAWVFTRSAGAWKQGGAKILALSAIGSASQGTSVSISADGNTAIVGGPYDSVASGAVWAFARTAGSWNQVGSRLSGTGAVNPADQGQSAAISGDGSTIIAGGPSDNSSFGSAWVFARSVNGIAGSKQVQPATYTLEQNYPNPFNPSTTIRFNLPEAGIVRLAVYSILGEKVADLLSGWVTAGQHYVEFNAAGCSSGLYIYRLSSSHFVSSRKMVYIK